MSALRERISNAKKSKDTVMVEELKAQITQIQSKSKEIRKAISEEASSQLKSASQEYKDRYDAEVASMKSKRGVTS